MCTDLLIVLTVHFEIDDGKLDRQIDTAERLDVSNIFSIKWQYLLFYCPNCAILSVVGLFQLLNYILN